MFIMLVQIGLSFAVFWTLQDSKFVYVESWACDHRRAYWQTICRVQKLSTWVRINLGRRSAEPLQTVQYRLVRLYEWGAHFAAYYLRIGKPDARINCPVGFWNLCRGAWATYTVDSIRWSTCELLFDGSNETPGQFSL
jgi:hypothetical protein